ncbi:5607_t:CDS:2 [Acaulospora colombiana]|uniref:5607_t:CDS:1 n=1 Tax=Acaulospora colombiana TaxID=27376 RepID=A0ACA9KX25_9GLOM|nr:5607_t:CDS:2 [Acaulospora colombiana]
MQMIWVWTISLPLIFLNSPRISDPNIGGRDVHFGSATDIAGVILFLLGWVIESVADIQKSTLFLEFPIYRYIPEKDEDNDNRNLGTSGNLNGSEEVSEDSNEGGDD